MVGQETEVANAHEASWQHVLEEAPQEFNGGKRHLALFAATRIVLPAKRHLLDVESEQAVVADGHAVSVASEIAKDSRWATEGGLGEAPKGIRAHWLGGVELPISSTDVRERLRSGANTDELLPSEVAEYVSRHGLYRA